MFRVFPIIACIMICASSSLKAQNQRKDSSTLEHDTISASDTTKVRRSISRKDNVELNNDMKNYIDFNFFGNSQTINDSPYMEQSKSWMKFNTDATKSSMYAPKNKDLRITMKINPNSHTDIYSQSDLDIQNRRIGTPIEDGNAMTAGVGIKYTFDAEKLLYENLTERGRTLKHNRKYANAWKNYKNYIPEKDSIQRDSTLLIQDVRRIANDLVPLAADSVKQAQ